MSATSLSSGLTAILTRDHLSADDRFRNDDAFDEHIQTDEFQKLVNNADWLAEPPQMFSYRDVPLGDGEGSEDGSAQVE